jgi:hypothetical protein
MLYYNTYQISPPHPPTHPAPDRARAQTTHHAEIDIHAVRLGHFFFRMLFFRPSAESLSAIRGIATCTCEPERGEPSTSAPGPP